tara:strand:- start:969 stop:1112 length:144 start_codon:yes stop_codon:yes gene_type:complete
MKTDKRIYIIQLTNNDGKITNQKVITNNITDVMLGLIRTREYVKVKF